VKTYEIETPSGGRHCYYATDEPVPSGRIAPGIDVKSRGGMVLAPPSSINGRNYVLKQLCLPPIRLPVSLFYMRSEQIPYDNMHSAPRRVLKQPQHIKPGERNTQLMANAACFYAKVPPAVAREMVHDFNRLMPEPLSSREVKNIIDWLEAREGASEEAQALIAKAQDS
jgi:hypothetical protein